MVFSGGEKKKVRSNVSVEICLFKLKQGNSTKVLLLKTESLTKELISVK